MVLWLLASGCTPRLRAPEELALQTLASQLATDLVCSGQCCNHSRLVTCRQSTHDECELHVKELQLKSQPIKGDLTVLSSFTSLQYLDLAYTRVSFDLALLSNMTQMQWLRLDKTDISGDLASLSRMKKMQHLSLSDVRIVGDMMPLSNMTEIHFLTLRYTGVSGDMAPISKMTCMRHLSLSNTQVSGDLASLSSMTQLKNLSLRNTNVSGDLASLSNMTQMQHLYLRNSQVFGDLTHVSNMTHMQTLSLRHMRLSGNLVSLSKMTRLQSFSASYTEVTGDLKPFANMFQMKKLSISNSRVSGDLVPLSKMMHMQRLSLRSVQVFGDMAPLRRMTELHWLYLHDTQVSGEFTWLINMRKMKYLNLQRSHVSGDLSSLSNMTQMHELYLSNTRVIGDLAHLSKMTQVRKLFLSNTMVSGELAPLNNLTQLQSLLLSNTHVIGNAWKICALPIRTLDVSGTSVYFDFEKPVYRGVYLSLRDGFDKLVHLDLSRSLTIGSARDVLLVLGNFGSLAKLKIGHSNLSGNLPSLNNVPYKTAQGLYETTELPLYSALVLLDLQATQITDLDAQWMQQDHITLDLRNAKLLRVESDFEGQFGLSPSQSVAAAQESFQCFGLDNRPNLLISPEFFAPNHLCGCRPGYDGIGTRCKACPLGYYNAKHNGTCRRCDFGYRTEETGATRCQLAAWVWPLVFCFVPPMLLILVILLRKVMAMWRRELMQKRDIELQYFMQRQDELVQQLKDSLWRQDLTAVAAVESQLLQYLSDDDEVSKQTDAIRRAQSEEAGVSVAYLLSEDFLKLAQARTELNDPSFDDMKNPFWMEADAIGKRVICPRDKQPGCALIDTLTSQHRQACTHFLSWVWRYHVMMVRDALALWIQTENLDASATFLFMCFFNNNQYRILVNTACTGSDNLETIFETRLARIGRMVALLDDWQDPVYLSRIWTIFEQYTAVKLKLPVSFVLAPPAVETMLTELNRGKQGIERILVRYKNIQSENASATFETDTRKIRKIIQETVGFDTVNQRVRESFITWVSQMLRIHMSDLLTSFVNQTNAAPQRGDSSVQRTSRVTVMTVQDELPVQTRRRRRQAVFSFLRSMFNL